MDPNDPGKGLPPGPGPAGPAGPDAGMNPHPQPPQKKPTYNSQYLVYPQTMLGLPNGNFMPSPVPTVPTAAVQDQSRALSYIPQQQYAQTSVPVLNFPGSFVNYQNQQAADAAAAAAAAAANDRRKTNRTPVACVICHKAKSTCDRSRPCARCRRLGKAHLCKDRPHRKKGRPRKRLLGSDETNQSSTENVVSMEKKARPPGPPSATSSSDPQRSFKLSDCYLGNEMPRFVPKKSVSVKSQPTSKNSVSEGTQSVLAGNGTQSSSSTKQRTDTPLTELQNNFAQMAKSVNDNLWDEIIGDMSSFITDAKKYQNKYKTVLSKMPNVKRVLNPIFCMYLTHMSYYLHPTQFIQLQTRMANAGVLIPNGSSCKIRKFDENLTKTHDCKAVAPINRLRWCLKHPRPHMESRFSRIDNWPLATIKVNLFSTPDPLTLLVYVSVNEEFERIFGFRQAEMVLMSRRPFYYRLIQRLEETVILGDVYFTQQAEEIQYIDSLRLQVEGRDCLPGDVPIWV
eukprot:CAMPEP_0114497600 /NCGR_PEP_ID=MMETSP0109-20121206/6418_1 /TAXON_ID=29199 /ORGANISM="Chlorarachnion reptans, Strain CCCM449" /LENGTH=510 /DNA_ID=CAMNT_0001675007 /DNA_START=187 /DNA_END=1719 /DNA_ORIENTATION=+